MCLEWLLNRWLPWRLVDNAFNRATNSYKLYGQTRNPQYLNEALDSYAEAYKGSNDAHEKYPTIIMNYAIALHSSYQRPGAEESSSADEVNRLFNQALKIVEGKSPRPKTYPSLLINMGKAYSTQYRKTKDPRTIKLAIEKFNRVRTIDDMTIPNATRRQALIGLSFAFWTQCELDPTRGQDTDLDDAKTYLRDALTISTQPRDQAECYQHLASTYDVVYQRHKDRPEELNEAIECNIKALECRPQEPTILFNLAKQHWARFVVTQPRVEEDLQIAEDKANEVIKLAQESKAPPDLRTQASGLLDTIGKYRERGDTMFSMASADSDNQRSDTMLSTTSLNSQNQAGSSSGGAVFATGTYYAEPGQMPSRRPSGWSS